MNSQVIHIVKGNYFNGNAQFILTLLGGIFIIPIVIFFPIMFFLLFIFVPLFTTKMCLDIDIKEKWVKRYNSTFGEKKGKVEPFGGIDKIYINKNRYSKGLQSRGTSVQTKFMMYGGYIKTSENKKYLVYKSRDKNEVMKRLHQIADPMGKTIADNTSE